MPFLPVRDRGVLPLRPHWLTSDRSEEARRWLADQRRKKEHPGQEGLFEALDENR